MADSSYAIDFPSLLRNFPDDSGSNWYSSSLRKAGRDYGIYVGTGGNLSVVPFNKELYAGNVVTFKNVPDGTFMPILASRVAWDAVNYLEEGDALTHSSPSSSAPDSTIDVSSGLTTSGSGDIVGMTLAITVASGAVTAVTVKTLTDKASADGFTTSDTITIPAGWDKAGGSAFNVTTSTLSTSAATTCADLCIFSKI